MLGMTKGRAALPGRAVAGWKALFITITTITPNESVTLPFVIPSAAEGSAV
jgi:hypothetical protein